jgi:hypothetical protein
MQEVLVSGEKFEGGLCGGTVRSVCMAKNGN